MMCSAKARSWAWPAILALVATMAAAASELPPEIAADRLMVRAGWQAEQGRHAVALATLDEVLSLREEHGLDTPDAFWFRHAQVAGATGEHARAVESATRYLTSAGRDGEHYAAALELLEASDRELEAQRQREAEQERLAAAEARDAAAYQALRERLSTVEGVFSDALQSGGHGPLMVTIPAGRFRMGCLSKDDSCNDDELPAHEVTIAAPFALSVHEVTFMEWDACVAAGGCGGHRPDDESWGRGTRPVINVSWSDAREYAAWLTLETGASYRLPSESEWEYAARAGGATKYHWGDEIGRNRANCHGCGSPADCDGTVPVASFAPNAWGLHDMHGNVEEWVEDCANSSYRGAPSDGSAWLRGRCELRILRGGTCGDGPRDLRAASRDLWFDHQFIYGFRVARTLAP